MNCRSRNSDRHAGFTLIEMMVVITIIVVLIGILVPVISYAKKIANNSATQHVLQIITMGIDQYHDNFSVYPPSTVCTFGGAIPSATSTTPGAHGSVTLTECLEGYLPYANDGAGTGNPQQTANNALPDPPYGFRTNNSGFGTIYGPYVSPDPKTLYTYSANTTVRYFVDVWGNEILYYRAVPSKINGQPRTVSQIFGTFTASATPYPDQTFNALFVKEDNKDAFDPWSLAPGQTPTIISDPTTFTAATVAHRDQVFWKSLGSGWSSTAATPLVPCNALYPGDVIPNRDSYLLLSAGYDGKFFTADDLLPPSK